MARSKYPSKFNIGLRYYSGEPEYEQTNKSYETTTKKVQMPATVLQLMVGINL